MPLPVIGEPDTDINPPVNDCATLVTVPAAVITGVDVPELSFLYNWSDAEELRKRLYLPVDGVSIPDGALVGKFIGAATICHLNGIKIHKITTPLQNCQ